MHQRIGRTRKRLQQRDFHKGKEEIRAKGEAGAEKERCEKKQLYKKREL